MTELITACDEYLGARTGKYEWRAVRYRAAAQFMIMNGLDDSMTIMDLGAGWTEFDYCLRKEFDWRGRYIPIDGGIDGTDLETWEPKRYVEWVVGLEIIEHMEDPGRLLDRMAHAARVGIVLSTPNPRTTDVLGMDATHKREIHAEWLKSMEMDVFEASFYGQENDSLFATFMWP